MKKQFKFLALALTFIMMFNDITAYSSTNNTKGTTAPGDKYEVSIEPVFIKATSTLSEAKFTITYGLAIGGLGWTF